MAGNQEKAHSMFYRFRAAQAAELGLGARGDSRPRIASACKTSVCECERWRSYLRRFRGSCEDSGWRAPFPCVF
ncbi:hypothetical protein K438DRAFT_1847942 [Mycena galopus ATCC 62051]|nr:hypothetical protein K438DRAFT_1847942 [Mycena galopus ATCC 62051]